MPFSGVESKLNLSKDQAVVSLPGQTLNRVGGLPMGHREVLPALAMPVCVHQEHKEKEVPGILIPNLGYATSESTILGWLKTVGEQIEQGEPVLEIATEKTIHQVSSPYKGRLLAVYAEPGAILREGETVGWIGDGNEAPPEIHCNLVGWEEEIAPAPENLAELLERPHKELQAPPQDSPRTEHPATVEKQHRSVLMGQLRRITALRMTKSWQDAPKVDLFADVDFTSVESHRKALKEQGREAPSYNVYIAHSVVRAFQDLPGFNIHWMEGRMTPLRDVNVGIAVALGDNLITVSLKNLAGEGLMEIQRRFKSMIRKALKMSLSREELYGSSLTITNLGEFDIRAFTAVLNPPEVFILAVGRVEERVVPRNGRAEIVPMCTFVLSFDHRAVDGAPASRLLQRIKQHMEGPFPVEDDQ